jgi:Ni/Fe-hydrogenase subunit HybB-like protein
MILSILKKTTILLVIAGIVLSTLHQSSLGSLFLIAPHRVHELWYSPIIYVLFFISAVALGLMMVTMESLLSAYFFGHKIRKDLLSGLGGAAAVTLALYTVLRLGDLAGESAAQSDSSQETPHKTFPGSTCPRSSKQRLERDRFTTQFSQSRTR